ncbi:MAG: acyl-CoA dehydrogenase [Spongiibacteraceae bacterium]
MKFELNDDQKMIQETAAKLFQKESTSERIREAEKAHGFDTQLWSQVVELGFPLMRVVESAGGLEMPLLDVSLVAEEHGRYIASTPLIEAIPANRMVSMLDSDLARALSDKVVSGHLITLMPQAIIDGDIQVVPWASVAEGVLALEGDKVVLLSGFSKEVSRNMGCAGHSLCQVNTANIQKTVLAEGVTAREEFLKAVEEWKVLTAAALVGLSRQSLKLAAEYACERVQFGHLIGSYQGIAHPLADSLADVEGMQFLVWRGLWAAASGHKDAAAILAMGFWWAADASARACSRALHTFGGYGVSLEYDIQLYYRRAKAFPLLAGDPQETLKHIGNRLWSDEEQSIPDVGIVEMDFSLGQGAEKMADEVRTFFEENMTEELKAKAHHSVAGYDEAFSKKLCAAGLRYPHWPEEYGGRDASPYEMAALNEVLEDYGWERITGPVTNQVAFGVMEFARQDVKDQVLGEFSRGDALACLGFSEPPSGSDIYAAKTRAVKDGDDWIINGQKMFTTSGNLAKYMFLLARTDPEKPKHRGITIFLVPIDLPGIEIQPVHTLQDERTNITYMEDVRVPDKYRLGDVDGGLKVMLHAMEMEHGGADQYRLNFQSMLNQAIFWAQNTSKNGKKVIETADTRLRLAKIATIHEVSKVLCYRSLWASFNKVADRAHVGPVSKLFTTEAYLKSSIELMDLAAPWSLFEDRHGAGHIELGYRQSIGTTIYGGTSEIMRSIISERGLGMPKTRS